MADADPKIVALIKMAHETGKNVSAVDAILDRLEESHLAYRMSLPPPVVGINPLNRDSYGVSEPEVHALGSEIVSMGWSWHACKHAVCIEDTEGQEIAIFSAKIKNATDGLQSAAPGEVRFGSLACTHTNQFLCCVLGAVPTAQDNLAVDGHMSAEKLKKEDEGIAKALTQGLEWLVLKAAVAKLYPELPSLVQAARNQPGQSQRMESEMQMLLRISTLARSMAKSVQGQVSVDWEAIRATILRRRTNNPADVPELIKFVQRWGGGISAAFIEELSQFHKTFVPSGRMVPAATFRAVADLKLAPDELMPYLASAIIKTQAIAYQRLSGGGDVLLSIDISSSIGLITKGIWWKSETCHIEVCMIV